MLLFKASGFVSFFPLNEEKMRNAVDSLPSCLRNCSRIKILIHFFDKRHNLTITFNFHVDHTAIFNNEKLEENLVVGDFRLRSAFLTEAAVGGCSSSIYIGFSYWSIQTDSHAPTTESVQEGRAFFLSFFHE